MWLWAQIVAAFGKTPSSPLVPSGEAGQTKGGLEEWIVFSTTHHHPTLPFTTVKKQSTLLYFPLDLGGFLFFWSWTFAPSSQSSQYRLLRVKVTHCQSLPRATQHRL